LITCSAIWLIIGALLAQRFRVFFLLPAIAIAAVAILLFEVASGHTVAHGLLAMLVISVALQLGFAAGVLLNGLVVHQKRSVGKTSRRVALPHRSEVR
jgi:putative Ca2+/H+ antiporter (TMEM165/GDT1 family)